MKINSTNALFSNDIEVVRATPDRVDDEYVAIQTYFYVLHTFVSLMAEDIMFLTTFCRKLG